LANSGKVEIGMRLRLVSNEAICCWVTLISSPSSAWVSFCALRRWGDGGAE
jgi:hypothetical protein